MSNQLVLDRAALRRCGIRSSNSTLLRWEKAGEFPRRIRIGGSVFWDLRAVQDHLERLVDEASR
jgi:prophage regulatory protein